MHNSQPEIIIIAAVGSRLELGYSGRLPWSLRGDLQRFKRLTLHYPVIMGRKTFESIGGSLPNRYNIVVTGQEIESPHHSVEIANSIEGALDAAKKHDTDKVYIIGGAEIYRQTLPFADTLELTYVHGEFDADAYFPDFTDFGVAVNSEEHEEGGIRFEFVSIKREKTLSK